jgi:hypothetical protein
VAAGVSTALATGLYVQRPDLALSRRILTVADRRWASRGKPPDLRDCRRTSPGVAAADDLLPGHPAPRRRPVPRHFLGTGLRRHPGHPSQLAEDPRRPPPGTPHFLASTHLPARIAVNDHEPLIAHPGLHDADCRPSRKLRPRGRTEGTSRLSCRLHALTDGRRYQPSLRRPGPGVRTSRSGPSSPATVAPRG